MPELVVPHRFRGPARSGNGGWTAGALATLAGFEATEVTLRRPPPLDTPLAVRRDEEFVIAMESGSGSVAEVATARPAAEPARVARVDAGTARAAESTYPGLVEHPFPTCFVCGTAREDGLRIFPGRVAEDPTRVAATWTPRADLEDAGGRTSAAVAWAALDCPGGWAGDFGARLMVLGRMTAVLHDLPRIGEEHVVVGEAVDEDGRKSFTAATLFNSAGEAIGSARHTWLTVDPAAFN